MKLSRIHGSLIVLSSLALSMMLCCYELMALRNRTSHYEYLASHHVTSQGHHHFEHQHFRIKETSSKKQEKENGRDSVQVVAVPPPRSKLFMSGKETCPSHYRNKQNNNEHSPVIFRKKNLMICRSPKVGSNELRSVATAYETDTPFEPPSVNVPYKGNILAGVKSSKAFNRYLYNNTVTRIMFVRHPVERILSAFLQTARQHVFWKLHGFKSHLGASPKTFRKWVMNETLFYKYYHSDCNEHSTEMDLHSKIQHWAPPQHCRCGIHDCGVKWNVYKIEEHSIQSVLKEYLPQKYLPPTNTTEIYHKREYTKRNYLTDDILTYLNAVTKTERDFFGYEPLTANDLI